MAQQQIPIMPVGKYAGHPVDQLPNSYLRWVLIQNFSPEITACAKRKLEQSQFDNIPINVSRHAIDMFSLRFLDYWLQRPAEQQDVGLGTFIARLAHRAWHLGIVSSLHRHQDDGPRRDHNGIRWVYQVSPQFPEYKEVVTCMNID